MRYVNYASKQQLSSSVSVATGLVATVGSAWIPEHLQCCRKFYWADCPGPSTWPQSQELYTVTLGKAKSGKLTPRGLISLFPGMTAVLCCWRWTAWRYQSRKQSFMQNISMTKGRSHVVSSRPQFQGSFYIFKEKTKEAIIPVFHSILFLQGPWAVRQV